MKQPILNTINILGFGLIDFEFSIKLSKSEEFSLNIDFDQIHNEKNLDQLLQNKEIFQKFNLNIKNFLSNMLVFLNKTSKSKNTIDIISLNSLSSEKVKYPLIKEKIFSFLQ